MMILKIDIPTAISIIYPCTLVGMIILGYWIAEHNYKKRNREWSGSGVENAVIGLYALLLSFTLLSSGNMHRDRNVMVHRASDAAARISRSSVVVSVDIRPIIKKHLVDYLNLQTNFFDGKIAHRNELLVQMDNLNRQFWSDLDKSGSDSPSKKEEIKILVPYYDELNSSFYRLVYSFDERTPAIVMFLLIVGSWLMAVLIGFMSGLKKHRHYLVPIIYFVLVSLTVQAIRDLNNPYSGSVRPDYENIIDLRNYLLQN